METLEQIKGRITAIIPGARVDLIPNECPSNQPSLLIDQEHGVRIAEFLRDDPQLRLDYLSNVTGVDWPDTIVKEKVKVMKLVEGVETEVHGVVERKKQGYLEVVYHIYSIAHKHGPVIVRLRTNDRNVAVHLPSLTPIWRSAEFQEREIYDLYGVIFDGHPDLRRILMWDGFEGHPMRKDYVEPDDYEYEPTPHDEVLERARSHQARNAVL
ncbi:MAG: NADH-quinone oxidoreductase subunit C [Pedosphaera sp.]|nr:NADH-quinone oxidoreductase subunit C [Pedosphaera sp.]